MSRGRPVSLLGAALAGLLLCCLPRLASAQPAATPTSPHSETAVDQAAASPPSGPFADWAALVVAGDWRAHDGGNTQAFDNGRRDIATALAKAGFSPGNVAQYSLRPSWPGDPKGLVVTAPEALQGFLDKAAQATGGCLVYITSHGSPDGAVFGPKALMTPTYLAKVVGLACPSRPSVIVVSACFSGVFAPKLAGGDRLVLTAARRDRASFGCGSSDVHTYFDQCMLSSLPVAHDFVALGPLVQACVKDKERATGARPPSMPQVSVGKAFRAGAGARPFLPPSG